MKEFAALFQTMFRNTFRRGSGTEDKKQRRKTIVTFIVLGVCFLPMLAGAAYFCFLAGAVAAQQGTCAETASAIVTAVQSLSFFFGIGVVMGALYFAKDATIVLSLPVSGRKVFLAKLTAAYLYEATSSAVLILFSLLPFGIGAEMGIGFYLQLPLTFLLIPLLPFLLAAILSVPLMYVVSFFRKKSLWGSLALILLFCVLFVGYYTLLNRIPSPDDPSATEALLLVLNTLAAVGKAVWPNLMLANMLFAARGLAFLQYFAISVGGQAVLVVLILFLSNRAYRRSLAKQLETPKEKKKGKKKYKEEKGGILWQLIKMDLLNIANTPTLAFQLLAGLLLVPLMVGVMGSQWKELLDAVTDPSQRVFFVGVLAALFVAMSGSGTAASSSFSREGTQIYITKALPISSATVLKEKSLLANCMQSVSQLLGAVVLLFVGGTWDLVLCTLLVSLPSVWAIGYLGVYLDLRNPRLHWMNVQEAVKNSPSALLSLGVAFACAVVIGLLGFGVQYCMEVFSVNWLPWVFYPLLFAGGVAAALLLRAKLYTKGESLYQKL